MINGNRMHLSSISSLNTNEYSIALHTALSHLDKRNTYARMLFIDYSSVCNIIVPTKLITKIMTLQLDPGLHDATPPGGKRTQKHIFKTDR